MDITPFLGPLLALAKSRKAMVAIAGFVSSLILTGAFALLNSQGLEVDPEIQKNAYFGLAGVVGTLIASIAYEDAAPPTMIELAPYEDSLDDLKRKLEELENAAK